MKHLKLSFIFGVMCLCFPSFMEAQTTTENATDSINNDKDQLVQVAFRKVAKSGILGGVSVIDMEELTKKNYNTYSMDNLQGYVGGLTGNTLWSMGDYLVLIDGIPRDANNIVPTEIEQITFLKGANAVALYGSRAAKGVVYITTKRGHEGPLKVSVRANSGYHVAKSYPKYMGSAEYMTLYNEALANDGKPSLYSVEDIYKTSSGNNPYRFPDVDFYSSDYLKKAYNRTDVTTEISGGNENARYYTNIGYYRQGDLFKFGEAKNNFTDRLNVRGNVDITINDWIKAFVNANATFYNSRSANAKDRDANDGITDNYWTYSSIMRPNRVSPLIPLSYINPNDNVTLDLVNNSRNIIDGQYFLAGSQTDMTNVFSDYYASGYGKWTSRQFQFDTGLDFDLANILKGLSFHTKFAVDYATSYTAAYNTSYATYGLDSNLPVWHDYNGTDAVSVNALFNKDEKDGKQTVSGSTDNQTIAFSGYFAYEKTINNDHNLSAMLIASGFQQTRSTVYHRTSNANLGLNLNYNFKEKYFADLSVVGVHSAKLPEGKRLGISPSITVGWYLSKESFLANSSVVDDLVLSISASNLKTDLDITDSGKRLDYYMYEQSYDQSNGAYWGWLDGASERSTNSRRGANPDLTFVKRKELMANVKGSFLKRLITLDASFFMNTMEGIPVQPRSIYPNYFFTYWPENVSFIPYMNFNDDKRTGFDFSVNLNKKLGSIDYSLGVSGIYYTTEAKTRDENYEFDYQNRAGKDIDGVWGVKWSDYFTSLDQIATSPQQKFQGDLKPGDIRYIDQNNDNIIDSKDEVFLGRGGRYGSPFTLGLNLTVKWKNLTFFALGTGSFGAYALKNNTYFWVYGDRKYSEVVRGRWTEQTQATATYPRLTTVDGSNNFRNSSYWLYKTDRFDLAKVQITYDLPKSMLQNFFLHEISAYISGSNLLTFSKEREILEMEITKTPQTRFYNVGIKASF